MRNGGMDEYEHVGRDLGVETRWSAKAGSGIDQALMYE
jgi:hypothetical protein